MRVNQTLIPGLRGDDTRWLKALTKARTARRLQRHPQVAWGNAQGTARWWIVTMSGKSFADTSPLRHECVIRTARRVFRLRLWCNDVPARARPAGSGRTLFCPKHPL